VRIGRRKLEQAAGADVRVAVSDLADELRRVLGDDDHERKLLLAREPLDEIVIEPGRAAVLAREPCGGTRTNDDDQRIDRGCRRGRHGRTAAAKHERTGAGEQSGPSHDAVSPSSGIGCKQIIPVDDANAAIIAAGATGPPTVRRKGRV